MVRKITINRSFFPKGNEGSKKFFVDFASGKKTFVRANNVMSAKNKIKGKFPNSKIKSEKSSYNFKRKI